MYKITSQWQQSIQAVTTVVLQKDCKPMFFCVTIKRNRGHSMKPILIKLPNIQGIYIVSSMYAELYILCQRSPWPHEAYNVRPLPDMHAYSY